ncbi:Crp/Fnr family transcriptional regulator [Ramlibacter sp. PS4R-6]|uniref:Crp/Fnr family transcriptional regulator n=1 Tax=Ramlibacter sp. PS4R-6 TaxID=3133438 RepID=UPI00309B1ECE
MAIPLSHNLFPGASMFIGDASRPGMQFILAQPWMAGLDEGLRQRIVDSVYTLQGNKGEVILKANEEVQGWYAVLTGLVKLQSQLSQGRRQGYLGIPGGEWFGEGSVMKNEPRRYDVIALRDSELLCLPRPLFEELYATSILFNQSISRHLNMRLGQVMVIIETMRLRAPDQRVAMYLGPTLWHGSRRMSLSQEELGILSGLSRQTVNTVLNEFGRQGLVSLDFGRIEIKDEKGLMAIAFNANHLREAPRG